MKPELRTRIITAGLLLPVPLLLFVFGPPWVVKGFLLVCATLSVTELATMLIPAFSRRAGTLAGDQASYASEGGEGGGDGALALVKRHALAGVTVLLGWALFLASVNGTAEVAVGGTALAAMAALLIGTFSAREVEVGAARAFGILISITYGVLPWILVWLLYEMGSHARYPVLVMAIAWSGDTGGYFGGRFLGGKLFGGRKLAPRISPKKTWEGAICGLLGSVVGALIINAIYLNDLGGWPLITKVALVAGAFGQAGDLVESTFKRYAGVKDSGVIFPGHGGFLDRVDAILFAAPVIWAILYYFR